MTAVPWCIAAGGRSWMLTCVPPKVFEFTNLHLQSHVGWSQTARRWRGNMSWSHKIASIRISKMHADNTKGGCRRQGMTKRMMVDDNCPAKVHAGRQLEYYKSLRQAPACNSLPTCNILYWMHWEVFFACDWQVSLENYARVLGGPQPAVHLFLLLVAPFKGVG